MSSDNGRGNGRRQCDAKSKQSGQRCKNPAMANGKCRLHGGKTPKGVASPHYKHGRYSKYGPSSLRDAAAEFLRDPDLLSLQSNLALCDARIADVLTKLDEGGSYDALATLRKLRGEYRAAAVRKDQEAQIAQLREMFRVIDEASDTVALLGELDKLTEQRRRLVDTETKRQTSDLTSITIERAYGFVDVLLDIVARHVKERTILQGIVEEVVTFRGPVGPQTHALPPAGKSA